MRYQVGRAIVLALLLSAAFMPLAATAAGKQEPCPDPNKTNAETTLYDVGIDCELTESNVEEELRPRPTPPTGPYRQKRLAPLCAHDRGAADDGTCHVRVPCEPSSAGDRYRLQERTITPGEEPPQWETVGEACFTPEDLEEIAPDITPGMVLTEFRRLTWPEADLVIEPPGGETLVNLPTIFHVTNTAPVTQTLTLLGQQITIQATPTEWTWHWATTSDARAHGDDTRPHTTTYPGVPYPGADVSHRYRRAGTVHPSVDVTYTGRFRVNDGPWTDLLDTRTVPGQPQQLDVIEASPVLER